MTEASTKWSDTARVGMFFLVACISACGESGHSSQGPKPVVNISVNPTDLVRGDTVKIQWSTTDATECLASGEWQGPRPTSGTENNVTRFSGKLLYTLTCTGPGGSTKNTIIVASHRGVSGP
jgi:hypothetical protein